MSTNQESLAERVKGHLQRIGSISDTPPGVGSTRLAFSGREDEVHGYARQIFEELGFHISTDVFMNLYADSVSDLKDAGPAVMIGTHLDTVSRGGNYDGVVGFIVAVEAVRHIKERGLELPPTRIAIFRAEESTRFKKACLGSRAAFLGLSDDELSLTYESSAGVIMSLQQCVADAGGSGMELKKPTLDPSRYRAYFETHIEQASVLEHHAMLDTSVNLDEPEPLIGIVTSIRAPHRCEWEVSGDRAITLFAKCVLAVEAIATLLDTCSLDLVATVGRVEGFIKGADKINAIPGEVTFQVCQSLDESVVQRGIAVCKRRGCKLSVQNTESEVTISVLGTTDHSGGTPMGLSNRRDALVAACEILEFVPQEALSSCTSIKFYTDVRSNSIPNRDLANALIASTFEQIDSFERSTQGSASARVERLRTSEMSTPIGSLSGALRKLISDCAKDLNIACLSLPSGAGHDAMMAAIAGIPTGMMFIPSLKGLSHTPDEQSRVKDIVATIEVQANMLERMKA